MEYSREIMQLIIPYLPPLEELNEDNKDETIKQIMTTLPFDIKFEIALARIKNLYEETNGQCYLSFSGGKDSTIVAELIKIAQARFDLPHIPFVFSNTGLELDATIKFVEEFDYDNVQIIKPTIKIKVPIYKKGSLGKVIERYEVQEKPASFGYILKNWGKPHLSKLKSDELKTYRNQLNKGNDVMKTARVQNLILGKNLKNGKNAHHKLANKHYHMVHPDYDIKVSQICCNILKKKPFEKYGLENDINGYFTGMRSGEMGARSLQYKSCTSTKKIKDKVMINKMPIYDWNNETVDEFIELFNIKISEAYTVYGCERTGCFLCPFSNTLQKDLYILYKHEPNKYKASMHWLQDVFIQQLIKLEFDKEYMKEYKKQLPIIEQRRYEMLLKYKPEIAHK